VPDRPEQGLLDTSVVIDLDVLDVSALPREPAISAVTLAELAAGPHSTSDPAERGRRQLHLQRIESVLDALPFDGEAARAYGRLAAITFEAGRKARGARAVDLMIAATALSNGLPLYTRNGDDVGGLDAIMEVVVI
jgi:predicted nucleic acid-binding protein